MFASTIWQISFLPDAAPPATEIINGLHSFIKSTWRVGLDKFKVDTLSGVVAGFSSIISLEDTFFKLGKQQENNFLRPFIKNGSEKKKKNNHVTFTRFEFGSGV
jgi:hypothetical protein